MYEPQDVEILPYGDARNFRDTDIQDLAAQLVQDAKSQRMSLTGEGGLLTSLTKQVLQTALEAEMSEHLGYEYGDRNTKATTNYRNGSSPKTVRTEVGEVELDVPRDRDGSFDPIIVPKHKRRIDGFDDQVLSLYSKGMTTDDIATHLEEVYSTKVSKETVSRITDAVVGEMKLWQNRPLERVYPVIIIDAIVIKIRDGQVANRPVYAALSIDCDGNRDVLGLWVGPSGGEGAKQWLSMLTDIKNRGVQDVCIVCCDGLKGLPESIRSTWPEATVQTCVVHLIRNSLRHVAHKDMKKVADDLRHIYSAPNEEAALMELERVSEIWRDKYPAMLGAWERNWTEFSPFLQFPPEVRKIIYTTNAIESLNAKFRRAIRKRGHFPTEQSALKVLYLTTIRKEGTGVNAMSRIGSWSSVYNTLLLMYGDRLEIR
jgi:transposase-like protein